MSLEYTIGNLLYVHFYLSTDYQGNSPSGNRMEILACNTDNKFI